MFKRDEKILVEKTVPVRFFTEQITIRGKDDSISRGEGFVDFFSRGQLDDESFVDLTNLGKTVSLMSIVTSPFMYEFGGVTKTMAGAELLTALKAVYEKSLSGDYDPKP